MTLRERFQKREFKLQGCRYNNCQGNYRFCVSDNDELQVTLDTTSKRGNSLELKSLQETFAHYIKQLDYWNVFLKGLDSVDHLKQFKTWDPERKTFTDVRYRNESLSLDYVITYYYGGVTSHGHIEKALKKNRHFIADWYLDEELPRLRIPTFK